MKLNRWQRTWIAVSLALTIPVAVVTWIMLPSAKPLKEAWAAAVLSAVKDRDDLGAWESQSQVKLILFGGLDNDGVIEGARKYAQESYERNSKTNPRYVSAMLLDINIADDWYGSQLAVLRAVQFKWIANGGTIWLVMTVLAYAVIRSAEWIRRGRPAD